MALNSNRGEMFKVILEGEKCETGEKFRLEQEVPFDIFKKVADVLAAFLGISIVWPRKGGGDG